MQIRVCGMDPSLRNWGIALGTYDTETRKLEISQLSVTNPDLPEGKQVRQNSKDISAAFQLYSAARIACEGIHAVFVEVPVGSQSARSMASYGVCVGVLGALRGQGIPFYEMTPTEVKLAGFGKPTATKQQMITWAMNAHPEAPWPMYHRNGKLHVTEAKAEHMADAIGAIHAGIQSNSFQQYLNLIDRKQNANLFEPNRN